MITPLLGATNNLDATAFVEFLEGVNNFGIPSRVRGDGGTENNDIEKYMTRVRGDKSYIRRPSVHNQRIERLHYDTTHYALVHFINLFKFMEVNGILDTNSGLDLFCLHKDTSLVCIMFIFIKFRTLLTSSKSPGITTQFLQKVTKRRIRYEH